MQHTQCWRVSSIASGLDPAMGGRGRGGFGPTALAHTVRSRQVGRRPRRWWWWWRHPRPHESSTRPRRVLTMAAYGQRWRQIWQGTAEFGQQRWLGQVPSDGILDPLDLAIDDLTGDGSGGSPAGVASGRRCPTFFVLLLEL